MVELLRDLELAAWALTRATAPGDAVRAGIREGRSEGWWLLRHRKNRLRGDVITDFGLGGDAGWRMATSCSPSPVGLNERK